MPRHHGKCPVCGSVGALTRHHLFPVRFFGKGGHNESIFLLCRDCHTELETYIPVDLLMPRYFYVAVVAKFMKEKSHAL